MRMNETERAIFAAAYIAELESFKPATDNSNAEAALVNAEWTVLCYRQAVRERKRWDR